jgi:hypothetical protein
MKYEPKMIYNPSSSEKEFMHGGITHIFAPKEKRILEGPVAHHALTRWKGLGLVDYTQSLKDKNAKEEEVVEEVVEPIEDGTAPEGEKTVSVYAGLPWKDLVALGSARKVFKPGMKKEELLALLEGEDEQAGTV